jgi:hypothetical protein
LVCDTGTSSASQHRSLAPTPSPPHATVNLQRLEVEEAELAGALACAEEETLQNLRNGVRPKHLLRKYPYDAALHMVLPMSMTGVDTATHEHMTEAQKEEHAQWLEVSLPEPYAQHIHERPNLLLAFPPHLRGVHSATHAELEESDSD